MRLRVCLFVLALAGCQPASPPTTPPPAPSPPPAVVSPPTAPAPTPIAASPPTKPTPPPVPKPPPAVDVRPTKVLALPHRNASVALSPDGGTAVVIDTRTVFYDLASGKPVGPPLDNFGAVKLAAGGKTACYFRSRHGEDSEIVVRDVAAGTDAVTTHLKNGLESFAFAASGKLVVTGRQETLAFVAVPGGKPAFPPAVTPAKILAMSDPYATDTRLATLHADGRVRVWDLTTGKQIDALNLDRPTRPDEVLQVSPDGRLMRTIDHTGNSQYWDLPAKTVLPPAWRPTLNSPEVMAGGRVFAPVTEHEEVTYGPDGKATVTPKRYVVAVHDAGTGRPRAKLVLTGQELNESWQFARASADGRRVVLLSTERATLYVFDLPATLPAQSK